MEEKFPIEIIINVCVENTFQAENEAKVLELASFVIGKEINNYVNYLNEKKKIKKHICDLYPCLKYMVYNSDDYDKWLNKTILEIEDELDEDVLIVPLGQTIEPGGLGKK